MKESELGPSEASRRSKEKMSVSRTLAFSFSFVVVVYFFAKRFAQSTRCRRKTMLYENLTCACEYLCVTVSVCVCVNVCCCCACVLATVERDVNIGRKTGSFQA